MMARHVLHVAAAVVLLALAVAQAPAPAPVCRELTGLCAPRAATPVSGTASCNTCVEFALCEVLSPTTECLPYCADAVAAQVAYDLVCGVSRPAPIVAAAKTECMVQCAAARAELYARSLSREPSSSIVDKVALVVRCDALGPTATFLFYAEDKSCPSPAAYPPRTALPVAARDLTDLHVAVHKDDDGKGKKLGMGCRTKKPRTVVYACGRGNPKGNNCPKK